MTSAHKHAARDEASPSPPRSFRFSLPRALFPPHTHAVCSCRRPYLPNRFLISPVSRESARLPLKRPSRAACPHVSADISHSHTRTRVGEFGGHGAVSGLRWTDERGPLTLLTRVDRSGLRVLLQPSITFNRRLFFNRRLLAATRAPWPPASAAEREAGRRPAQPGH